MLRFAVRYIAGALAFPLADYLLWGVWCDSLQSALLAGAVLMLFYLLLRPVLKLLTIAFSLLTLGLFATAIDTLLVILTARLFPYTIAIKGPEWALLAALIVNVVRYLSGKAVRA
ncbi:MAG: phage holin family protein [Clostridiales bacterium]|nr:phage holin family protein [Clostridiales bacterium]